MKAPNHVVGGIVFTGFFGSILGFNVLSSPWYLALTIYASLFPDIDHTKSWVGKSVWPLAKWIDRKYGHRTITHSIWFLMATTTIVQFIQSAFWDDSAITLIWLFGNLSHLIFDMMTVQGVPLFYPMYMNACVLPANPSSRMRTNDKVMEAKVFGVFVVFLLLLQPLMSNGFWTSYNRLFGTMKHVASEYRKSEDLLVADYRYKVASDVYEGSGYVVEITNSKAALIQGDRWKVLDKAEVVVEEIVPRHSGIQYEFIYDNFLGVDADSLNDILRDKMIIEYEFQGNRPFTIYEDGLSMIQSRAKGKYVSDIYVQPETADDENTAAVPFNSSPRIRTLASKIEAVKRRYQKDLAKYQESRVEVFRLKDQYDTITDIYDKEQLLRSISELVKVPAVDYPEFEIKELEIQIIELKNNDTQKHRDKVQAARAKAQLQQQEDLIFTGYIRYFQIKENNTTESEI